MLAKPTWRIKAGAVSELRRLGLLGIFGLLLACSGARPLPESVVAFQTGIPEGFWQDERESGWFLETSRSHLRAAFGGQVQEVAKVLSWENGRIRVCQNGSEKVKALLLQADSLVVSDLSTGEERRLRRLPARPPSLSLEALSLPPASALPQDQVRNIQAELSKRRRMDQEAMVGKSRPGLSGAEVDLGRVAVASENARYLKGLISRVGWIDTGRFGFPTSNSAFLLVQHSGDLPLMMAALEGIRKDLEAGHPVGEPYALLFDRLQLRLGERQRYGTQIGRDLFGQPLVLPTEDPEKVAALREELGIFPLLQAVRFFGGSEVRFSSECGVAPGAAPHP